MKDVKSMPVTFKVEKEKTNSPTNRGVILPGFSAKLSSTTRTVIAFDWIEYTGKKTIEFLQKKGKKVILKEGVTENFKKIYFPINGKFQHVADLTIELKAGIDKAWCKVKIQNKYCYQAGADIVSMIQEINTAIGIDFKNFTRLDVCCDFQSTDYRSFSPQMFMEKIAKRKYVIKGRKCKTIEGQNKVSENVVQPLSVVSSGGIIETVKAGSKTSGIAITMYNKTKEMKAKTYKPWIAEQWKEAGFYADMDTFRIEFNYMKAASTYVTICQDTGELKEVLQHENINTLMQLNELFATLWNKYFQIGIAEKGVRFSRLKKVEILKFEKTPYIKCRLSEKAKSTNYIKAGIRSNVGYAVEKIENQEMIHGNEVLLMVNNMVDRYGLNYWFKKNFPEISQERKSIADSLEHSTLRHLPLIQGILLNN